MAGFVTGLFVALMSLRMALPDMLKKGLLNLINDGDLMSGEDPKLTALALVLVFLFVGLMTSFSLTAIVLLNGSKTAQFLFLWSLVLSGYVALIGIAVNLFGIVVLGVYGALVEGEWGFLIVAIICVYPAYISVNGSHYCIVKSSKVSNRVYEIIGKTGST
jgi:hypothetical protein